MTIHFTMKKFLTVILFLSSINGFSQMMPLVKVRCTTDLDGDTFEILWQGVKRNAES